MKVSLMAGKTSFVSSAYSTSLPALGPSADPPFPGEVEHTLDGQHGPFADEGIDPDHRRALFQAGDQVLQ